MSFNKSDVFHVVDTLHNGVVGSWQAFRMGKIDYMWLYVTYTGSEITKITMFYEKVCRAFIF